MLRSRSIPLRRGALLGVALALWTGVGRSAEDPLAAAIAARQRALQEHPPTSDDARKLRSGAEATLDEAAARLDAGQRWSALAKAAEAIPDLAAVELAMERPADERGDLAILDREWRRLGPELAPGDGAPRFDYSGVPAAARAIGEAAEAQAPVYYRASLDYGRNTAADAGLYYLGTAAGELEVARLASRSGGRPRELTELAPRSVAPELAALDAELLAAYRPPRSIQSHPDFIRISALVKQARELDAAGLRYGALYRLLEARSQLSRLLRPERVLTGGEAAQRIRAARRELAGAAVDPSLAELFLERADVAAADRDPTGGGWATAAAILDDVLPLYRTALGPAPPRPPDREPEAIVTLVRWPYT